MLELFVRARDEHRDNKKEQKEKEKCDSIGDLEPTHNVSQLPSN